MATSLGSGIMSSSKESSFPDPNLKAVLPVVLLVETVKRLGAGTISSWMRELPSLLS